MEKERQKAINKKDSKYIPSTAIVNTDDYMIRVNVT